MANRSLLSQAAGLVIFLAMSLGAGGIGSIFTTPSVGNWYQALHKPSWTPPDWVFAPVWTTLFVLMAVAAWMVWRKAGISGAKESLGVFLLQLALNSVWSWLFFGLHNPTLAMIELALLWMAVLGTACSFWRIRPAAAVLLFPYLGWLTFAAALNFAIARMNG